MIRSGIVFCGRSRARILLSLLVSVAASCSDSADPPSDETPQAEAGRGEAGRKRAADSGGAGGAGRGGSGGSSQPSTAGDGASGRTGGSAGASGAAANGGSAGSAGGTAGDAGESGGGAGEPGSQAETPTAEEISASLAAAVCEALESCVGKQKLAALNAREDCAERFTKTFTQDDFGSLQASIDAGSVVLDPAQIETCYADTRALRCDVQTERLPASCQAAIAAQRSAGDTCTLDADCKPDTYCTITAACPRTCEATGDEGADCTRDAECDRGTICVAGKCAAPVTSGEPCAGNSGAVCALGLSCVGSTDAQPGACRPNAEVQAGAVGAVCSPGGTLCKEGLSCAFDSGSTFKCVAAVGRGDTCRLALPAQCPSDTYCNATEVTTTGKCVALPSDGMPCVLGDDCAPGHSCIVEGSDATCRKVGDLGSACSSDALCRSGSCQDDVCALRTRCE